MEGRDLFESDREWAEKVVSWVYARLGEGKTVAMTNPMKSYQMTSKMNKRWERSGQAWLKVGKTGDLLMAQGRKYVVVLKGSHKIEAF